LLGRQSLHTIMIAELLKNKKLLASIVVALLFLFVVYSSLYFISAFFGALILAFLFRPLDKWLRKNWNFSKQMSAWTIIIISIILIILPTIFLIQGLIEQVKILPGQIDNLKNLEENVNKVLPFDVKVDKNFMIEHVVPILTKSITPFFSNILQSFAIFFLLFFLLYYFVIYSEEIRKSVYEIIPFNKKHKEKVLEKFRAITYSTIFGTFLIALIQGGLLAINFYFLGIPNALFWGFVAVILSFLPVIGIPILWVPLASFLIVNGDVGKGVALIVIGLMIGTIDNILRPIINEKYGKIHPVVSIVGIYIGILQFGVIGIFIGPLIVAYLVLFWKFYREEYVEGKI